MKIQTIIYPLCMAALLGSCHIYKPYSRPEVDTQGLYRDPVSVNDTLVSDTVNMANLPWEKVFTDPQLQVLIRLGLERNTDLQTAMLQVKEAQASLMTSRLSYLPSLTLAPQGGVSSFDRMKGSWSWSLPVSASWELDLFGKILNTKRAAKAALLRSEAYRQAVQTQVVAAIANYYYTLLMLDKQLQITEETAVLWGENVETMKAMKEAAMVNEAGVVQSEANYYMGSLTQPLFYRGANIARLKIAKAQQAEAMLSFEQAILNAGADVSDALSLYQSAEDKRIQRVKQINSLEKSVEYTQELLTLGTSNTNYLEVLTAQQSLLNAQLSGISDEFQRLQAVVNLYHALGGGTK